MVFGYGSIFWPNSAPLWVIATAIVCLGWVTLVQSAARAHALPAVFTADPAAASSRPAPPAAATSQTELSSLRMQLDSRVDAGAWSGF